MNRGHRLRAALACLVLALGATVATTAPAAAAPCQASSCVGHDPAVYGCPYASITTVNATLNGTVLATLWNKYSTFCKANWASAQLTQAAINAGDTIYVQIQTDTGPMEQMCFPGPSNTGSAWEPCQGFPNDGYCCGGFPYTDMVDGTVHTTATVYVVAPDKLIVAENRIGQ